MILHGLAPLLGHDFEKSTGLSAYAICMTDSEGVILGANPQLADLFGYAPEDLLGQPIDLLIVESFHKRHPNHREALTIHPRSPATNVSPNLVGLRKDGRRFPIAFNTVPVKTSAGHSVVNFVREITERTAIREAPPRDDAQFRSVVESVRDYAIYLLDTDGYVRTWNSGAEQIKGYSESEALGLHFSRFFNGEDADRNKPMKLLHQAAIHGRVEDQGWRVRKDRSCFWADSILTAIRGDAGEITGFAKVTRDISERKRTEDAMVERFTGERHASAEALRSSEARYRSVFQTSPDAVAISRMSDGVILDVNQAFLDITGYERDEIVGRTTMQLRMWANARDRFRFVELLRNNSGCRDLELQFRRKSKEVFWARLSVALIEIDGAACILSFARDISEARVAEEKIKDLAFYDPLTGLANRRLLYERLTQSLATTGHHHRNRALLFIDLDDFKTLNDTLGHHIGDLMLQEVGLRLANCIRETDTVGRIGGDEFVVILEDLSELSANAATQAKAVAEKILAAVALPYMLAGHDCRSSSSIGITVFNCSDATMNEILQQGDIAMYQAKMAGRNRVQFFAPELQAAVNARATEEDCLRQAIRKNQFVLLYQPQLNNGRVIGAEALVRWNRPGRGIVLPNEFIQLAEKTGLIVPLGDWVLESACKQIAIWSNEDQMAPITLSVNISVRQMRQSDFIEKVLSTLERTGANPRNLRLELTESMFVEDFEEIVAKMKALKEHGLRFSVDDFGTGFSSLSYLNRLPIDELKIERSFVRNILTDANSGAIAESIILLSRALGLTVIAEGVETEEQKNFLANLGCSSYQGWLYGRAVPAEDFQAMCQQG